MFFLLEQQLVLHIENELCYILVYVIDLLFFSGVKGKVLGIGAGTTV